MKSKTDQQDQTDWAMTPKKEQRQEIHKAAEVCGDWQDACAAFFTGKSHDTAEELISKCDDLLEAQNVSGTTFVNSTSIRHRKMVAQSYIESTPKPTKKSTGIWDTYLDENGHKVTKIG